MPFVDDQRIPDQPYPRLREVLEMFVEEEKKELAENLVGIYLVGSLALKGFNLDSDIDFLIVIDTELSAANTRSLPQIQTSIFNMGSYPARHLEGSFLTISDLNDWSTVGKKEIAYFDNGSTQLQRSTHDNQWHVRWILREHGITLIGPRPESLLRPVPVDELRGEMKTRIPELLNYFQEDLDRPLSYWNSQFGQSFSVLTCCRMLHTLQSGTVESKKAAADWAEQALDPRWNPLIDRAWQERKGTRFGLTINRRAQQADLNETFEFLKYAADQT